VTVAVLTVVGQWWMRVVGDSDSADSDDSGDSRDCCDSGEMVTVMRCQW
jgi:hypothetical protein